MIYMNTIARIVHGIGIEYLGVPNKVTSNGFLLVWKFPDSEVQLQADGSLKASKSFVINNIADCALLSCLKILCKISREPQITEYKSNEAILEVIPNYQVSMGFGLHMGLAIEGAIGSTYKIDTTYLSNDVSIANWLLNSSEQYG